MYISNKYISTKDLAKELRVSVATVNYYTNLGLFNIQERQGNRRLYDKMETLSVFEKIHHLRREGYSLRLIQRKLDKGYST
ncbi:MAG: helix-turn-helix domain-containing protein [Candidatus Omnitrophota bacterium]